MGLFLSTSKHKIDRKGRVSVPASFRAALEAERFRGVALASPLSDDPCLEGCGLGRIERLADAISLMNPLDPQRDVLSTALLAGVRQAAFDAEGRIVLPEDLISAAALEGEAVFAGLGDKFQIWSPAAFEARRRRAREAARALTRQGGAALPWPSAPAAPEQETDAT